MKQLLLLTGLVVFCMPQSEVHAQTGHEIRLISFDAKVHSLRNHVYVVWTIADDTSLVDMVLENSQDNISYSPLTTIPHVSTGELIRQYDYWHLNVPRGMNWYRLRFVFRDGSESLSRTIRLFVGPVVVSPTLGGWLKIQGDQADPWTEAMITDITGRPILSFTGNEVNVDDLPSGIYVIRVQNSQGWQSSLFTK